MEKILFFLMLFIFTVNALFLLFKFKAESLSSEWYYLKSNWKYLFPAITMLYSTIAIYLGIQFSEFALLAGVPLYYVAAAPEYKTDGTKSITHFGGAILSILGSIIMACSLGYWWLSVLTMFATVATWLVLIKKYKITFYMECYFFYSYSLMLSFLLWK